MKIDNYHVLLTPRQRHKQQKIEFAKRVLFSYSKKLTSKKPIKIPEEFKKLKTLKFIPSKPKEAIKKPIKIPYLEQNYSLITSTPANLILAGVIIKDKRYNLIEPHLTNQDLEILEKIKTLVKGKEKLVTHPKFIDKKIKKLKKDCNIKYIHKIKYYLIRDLLGYGKIDPLVSDKNVKIIHCNRIVKVTWQQQELETNINLNKQELNSIIEKFATQANQHISLDNPTLNTTINNLKINAQYGTEIKEPKLIITKL